MIKKSSIKQSIYHTAQLYDDIHWWKKDDMDFWSNLFFERKCKSVLELACGTGRLAPIFLRQGAEYTGLEVNYDFIKAAKKKLFQYQNVNIIKGDMRFFNLNKTFDFIFIGFNSFLHLLTDTDMNNFLQCVKKHMHKNTCFLIDIYIPNSLFLYKPEGHRFPVLEFTDTIKNKYVFVEESNIYDTKTDINKMTWYFSTKEEADFDIREFFVRMYFPSYMNQILIDNGFYIHNQWGDYYRSPLNEASKLQIYDIGL